MAARDLPPAVVADLLHEFVGPLQQQSGADIELDLRDIDSGALTMATYIGRLTLRSSVTVPVPEIALRHAGDPSAFIAELIEGHLKRFGDRLRHASDAAATAWEAAHAGR